MGADGPRQMGTEPRFTPGPRTPSVVVLRDDASPYGAPIVYETRDLVRAEKVNAAVVLALTMLCSLLALYDLYLLATLSS